ncbi:carboxypeptidase A4 [Diaporthe helianthi]|uniref:Carboxypeptidase A4 n=1 Tax=Diaporthe helianthi TaxID=158607 RepID=A0A2P5HXH7_DIAHE|nr:carboxypeptidase A4 [Diaporthe helianthi]
MKSLLISSLLLPLATAVALPERDAKVDYTGYKALRVDVGSDETVAAQVSQLAAHVLNPGNTGAVDVVVAPDTVSALEALGVSSTVLDEDVGASLASEGELSQALAVPDASWFTAYHPYASHLTFLNDLQASFPANSEIYTIGASVGGRALTGIHIWGSGGKGSKPAVVFHGNVHAREWITSKTTQYIAYTLLTQYGSNAAVTAVVDKFDFYIAPVVNPDGFVYTQTTDRLWRKNRQTVSGNSCVGRDINRNWPYQWSATGGASTNPCSETYKGLAASDAPETRALVSQIQQLKASNGISLYIDFHSYGQYILWAYGYNCAATADNNAALQSLATAARTAIAGVSGTTYTIGKSCSTLYATTGSSVDYVDNTGNATYSYTYELRDRGTYGFVLPANQITPTAVETWAGVLAMLQRA